MVGRASTWSLLRWGVVAGPFYLTVGLAQALLGEGFDFSRHPLSVLASGPGGWVQAANFALTGLMVLAAAAGFARALGPKSRTVTWLLAGYGLSIIAGAKFTADPVTDFRRARPKDSRPCHRPRILQRIRIPAWHPGDLDRRRGRLDVARRDCHLA